MMEVCDCCGVDVVDEELTYFKGDRMCWECLEQAEYEDEME